MACPRNDGPVPKVMGGHDHSTAQSFTVDGDQPKLAEGTPGTPQTTPAPHTPTNQNTQNTDNSILGRTCLGTSSPCSQTSLPTSTWPPPTSGSSHTGGSFVATIAKPDPITRPHKTTGPETEERSETIGWCVSCGAWLRVRFVCCGFVTMTL